MRRHFVLLPRIIINYLHKFSVSNNTRRRLFKCSNSILLDLFLNWFGFLFFFYRFDEQFKWAMSKLLSCFLVLALVVMVDQTEGWRRRRCHARSCSVGSWSWWSSCSRSCGWGEQTRSRNLIRPSTCGRSCPYYLKDRRSCNTHRCPGEGGAISAHSWS